MSNENLPYNAAVSGVGVADVIGLTTERTIQASFPDLFDKFLGTANNINDVVDYSLLALLFAYGAGSEIVKYNQTQKDIETTKKVFLAYLDEEIKSSNSPNISEKRNASENKINEFAKKIFGDTFEVKLNWLADDSNQLVQDNPIVIIPKTDNKSITPKSKLIALIYEYLSSGLGTFWAMAGVFSFGYWVMFFLADIKGLASFSPEIAFTVPLTLPALYFGGKVYKKIKDKFLKYSANPGIITSELKTEEFAEKVKKLQAEIQSPAMQNPIPAPITSSALAEPVSFMRAFLMKQYHERVLRKIEDKFDVNLTDEDAANDKKFAKHPLAKIMHLSKKLELDLVLQQDEQKQPHIGQNDKVSVIDKTANEDESHLKEKFWTSKVGFVRKLVVALFSGAITGYCGAQFAQWPIIDFLANVFHVAGAAAPLAGIITFAVAVGVGIIFGVKAAFAKYKELKRHNKKLALIDAPVLEQNEQVEAQSAKQTQVTKLEYLESEKTKILSSIVFNDDIKQNYETALNNKAECENKIKRIKSLPQQIKNLTREIRQLNYFVNNKAYPLLRPFLVVGRAMRFIFNRLQNKASNEAQEIVAQKHKLIKDANDLLEIKKGKLKALQGEYGVNRDKVNAELKKLLTDLKKYQQEITRFEEDEQIKKYKAVAKLDAQIAAKKSKLTDIEKRRQAYRELNEKINRANSVREQVLRLEARSKVLSGEITKQIDKATIMYKQSHTVEAQAAIKDLQELKVVLKSKSFNVPSILTLDQIAEKKAVIIPRKGVKSAFGKISGHLFDFIARAGTGGYLIRSGLMLLQALKVVLPIAASILALINPFTAPIILGGAFVLGIGLFTMQKYLTYQQKKQQKIDAYLEDTQLMSIAADQQIETLNKAEEGLKKRNNYLTVLSVKLKDKAKSLMKPNPPQTKPTLGCLSIFRRASHNFAEKHAQVDNSKVAASAQIAGFESARKITTQS